MSFGDLARNIAKVGAAVALGEIKLEDAAAWLEAYQGRSAVAGAGLLAQIVAAANRYTAELNARAAGAVIGEPTVILEKCNAA